MNEPTLEEQNMAQLVDALDQHQITGADGELLAETTATEDSSLQEENTFEETETAEKPQESETLSSQDEAEDDEIPAVDEKGKRYIPESRLKKETAKRREAERRAQALEALVTSSSTQPVRPEVEKAEPKSDSNVDRLELRLVQKEYPQFNPGSDEYSQTLDTLAGNIRRANPNLSVMDAAEEAIKTAKQITEDQIKVAREARTVKALQSDQGITSRVVNRQPEAIDANKMSFEELEQAMKEAGEIS